ncbi:MAG: response regulator [Verrucomicrobiota bacterium]|nr:response regulator [Verrucomicrobiota bacterium]
MTAEISAANESDPPLELAAHPKMKIMIVDDEPLNVALLEDILAGSGYSRIQSVTDPRLAQQTWESFLPDLVLLDLNMPFIDGFTLLESLRVLSRELFLPIAILTADASEETKRRALRAGATDFLLKPFDAVEVLLRIGNMLEIRQRHLQLEMQRGALQDAMRERASELREARPEVAHVTW